MRMLLFSGIVFLIIASLTVFRSMIAALINSHTDLGLFVLLIFVSVFVGMIITFVSELFN